MCIRDSNEAENVLTNDARYSLFRRKLLEHVEGIVAASVKPMEKINDIRIMQLDGIGGGSGGGSTNKNATDEVIDSALRYRVQAPMVDSLLSDIGIDGANLSKMGGLVREARDINSITNDTARAKAKADATNNVGSGSASRDSGDSNESSSSQVSGNDVGDESASGKDTGDSDTSSKNS